MSVLLRRPSVDAPSVGGGGGGVSPISPSEFAALIEPTGFLGAQRPSGRLVCHGHHFTPGEVTDTVSNPSFYGALSWSGAGQTELHAGQVAGDTRRFAPVVEDGVPAFLIRTHYDGDATYAYQSGAYNSTVSPPNGDPLYYDGTRCQVDFAEGTPGQASSSFVTSGPGADTVALISTVKWGAAWCGAHSDTIATLFNVHASNSAVGASSGMSVVARNGVIDFARRWRADFVDRDSTPAQTGVMHTMDATALAGQWQAFVMIMKQSPDVADSPFCTLYHRSDGGSWQQLFDFSGPLGYTHTDASRNDENFPIGLSYYQYHVNNPIGGPRVRDLWYGGFGMLKNGGHSVADLQAHADSWMPA